MKLIIIFFLTLAFFSNSPSVLANEYSKSKKEYKYVSHYHDFWSRTEKFGFDLQTGEWELLPQEYYYVGKLVVVDQSFPIYSSPTNKEEIEHIDIGENILISICDASEGDSQNDWYMIVTEKGISGWAQYVMFEGRFHFPRWEDREAVQKAIVDLDGDGKNEIVSIRTQKNTYGSDSELTINNKPITPLYSRPWENFKIIDIDKSDSYKEIYIRFYDCVQIITYNNNTHYQITIPSNHEIFPGDGTIIVHKTYILNGHRFGDTYWDKTDTYILDKKSHMLIKKSKANYIVNLKGITKVPFAVSSSINSLMTDNSIKSKANITILECHDANKNRIREAWEQDLWYLVKTDTGESGWIREDELKGKIEYKKSHEIYVCHEEGQNIAMLDADLDGNGIIEHITLAIKDLNIASLTINDNSVELWKEYCSYLEIIDLYINDKYKEVAVCSPNGCGEEYYFIYRYDGENINMISTFKGEPEFLGNNFFYVRDWSSNLFVKHDKYVLDHLNRQIVCLPQKFYYEDRQSELFASLQLLKSPYEQTIIEELKKGAIIKVLACSTTDEETGKEYEIYDRWILLATESGICGWVQAKTLAGKISCYSGG